MSLKKVYVDEGRIGDSITPLPFLKHWADIDGAVIFGPYLHEWVLPHLPSNFIHDPNLKEQDCDYYLHCQKGFDYCAHNGGGKYNMIDGHFLSNGIQLPSNAHHFSFPTDETSNVDIVLSPFCSNMTEYRVWQLEKWSQLIDKLPSYYTKAVIGSATDDYTLFENRNVATFKNATLPKIAGLIKNCKLFVSIDTGTSHLAHVLGVKDHCLIYPHYCNIAANTHALNYRVSISTTQPAVTDIPLQPVVDMCYKILENIQ